MAERKRWYPIVVMAEVDLYEDLKRGSNSTGNRMASIPAYIMREDGTDGMLRRQCTNEYKISQVDKAVRRLYEIPGRKRLPVTEIWNGITADESHRMFTPRQKWKEMVYPFCGYTNYSDGKCLKNDMPIMRRNDVMQWYVKKGLPIPEKSACFFCPFMSDVSWLRLKRRSPGDFQKAVEIDKIIRSKGGSMKKVKRPMYLHNALKPLDEVYFDETQTEMWGDCYGFCNV